MNNFEVSNINKMLDRVQQVKQLYEELDEMTKYNFKVRLDWFKDPYVLIQDLEIIFRDCLDILQEGKE